MIFAETAIDVVGPHRMAELEPLREHRRDGEIGRIELVRVAEVEHAFGGAAFVEGGFCAFQEEPAANFGDAVPRAGPDEMADVDRVADGAEKNEDRECATEVERGCSAAVDAEGAAPEWTDVSGVRGAAKAVGRFDE